MLLVNIQPLLLVWIVVWSDCLKMPLACSAAMYLSCVLPVLLFLSPNVHREPMILSAPSLAEFIFWVYARSWLSAIPNAAWLIPILPPSLLLCRHWELTRIN